MWDGRSQKSEVDCRENAVGISEGREYFCILSSHLTFYFSHGPCNLTDCDFFEPIHSFAFPGRPGWAA